MTTQKHSSRNSSISSTSRSAFESLKPSRYIDFQIGDDWLPTEMKISKSWKDAFEASQYSASIMDAYRYSVFERATRLIDSGGQGSPSLPSFRQVIPTLLRARSYDEYRQSLDCLMGNATYTSHGLGWNEFDEPAMTVRANRSGLTDITIDYQWANSASPFTIAHDIIHCCNQIRKMKPILVSDPYLEKESDDQLAERLANHVNNLLRSDSNE